MSDRTEKRRKLWTYVHGEEDEEGCRRMERVLSKEKILQDELSRAQRADKALHTFMPGLAQTDDELDQSLETEIIEAWERSQAIGNSIPDVPANVIEGDFTKKTEPSHSPKTWRRIALGLAACALIAIGIQFTTAPSLIWQSPRIIPMEYRGEGIPPGTYTPEELKTLASRLQTAIQQGYDREAKTVERSRGLLRRRAWELRVTIREIAEGALEVRVDANHRTVSSEPRSWLNEFETANELTNQTEAFSSVVAHELVGPIEGADP